MNKLVVWGHHLEEYKEMFDLTQADLCGNILEFGCGPSAFNAELAGIATLRVSCDPLFNLDKDTLRSKATLIVADMGEQIKEEQAQFDFSAYGDLSGFMKKRREGLDIFFADYLTGKAENRYLGVSELKLPFDDFTFDFALSSHYLFADLDEQDSDFYVRAIIELARVAKEVRIFPLIDRHGQPSPCLGPVLLNLQQQNYGVEVRTVPYQLQPKGNAMLRIWAQACVVPK